jgi:hypothetical protein
MCRFLTGHLKLFVVDVDPHDLEPALGQTDRVSPVATGAVEDPLIGLKVEESNDSFHFTLGPLT